MVAITFECKASPRDVLAYAQILQDAGISQEQAKSMAKAQKIDLEEAFSSQNLATKADIASLENKIGRLESNMDAKMSAMEVRIMRSTYNAMFGLVAAMCAISAVIAALASFRVAFIK